MTPRLTLAALALSTATAAHAQERVTPMTPDVVASYDNNRLLLTTPVDARTVEAVAETSR